MSISCLDSGTNDRRQAKFGARSRVEKKKEKKGPDYQRHHV